MMSSCAKIIPETITHQIKLKHKPLNDLKLASLPTVSLFTGAGGLDLGFEVPGFLTYCCIENDSHSCITLRKNRDLGARMGLHQFLRHAIVIEDDIQNVNVDRILSTTNLKPGEVALVHGGPPCQAYSVFGKRRGLDDDRGKLIWEFVRLVTEIKPECFVLENVAGLKTYNKSSVLNELCDKLTVGGQYKISVHEYELANFGVPQLRKRIFIIGSLKGLTIPPMIPTHGENNHHSSSILVKPHRTVNEVLKGLGEPEDTILPNHKGRVHSQRVMSRYANLKFGQRDSKTRINKLDPDRPSFTIVVGSNAGGGKGHIHPYSPREVTPRESARIQTFPDFWEFSGTSRHPIRQVGNAVPPLFAALFAAHIRKYLFDDSFELSYEDAINYLGLQYLKVN